MIEIDFLIIVLEHSTLFVAICVVMMGLTYSSIRRVIAGGLFDPFALIYCANYAVNYSVIIFMVQMKLMDSYYFFVMAIFGFGMLSAFIWNSKNRNEIQLLKIIKLISPVDFERAYVIVVIVLYVSLAAIVVANIGLGINANTNRFDAAKGFGAAIRILDGLSPFIVSYWSIIIYEKLKNRFSHMVLLVVFIIFASVLNGAKASVILHISTIVLTISILKGKAYIKTLYAILFLLLGVAFALVVLGFNLQNNGVTQSLGDPISDTNILMERFVFRIIANGDTSYLTLPNGVIDNLKTDSIFARFISPIIGTGNLSNILGYQVADFSLGRQALLYYDPENSISGGPTSHFDLFGYLYFGEVGGFIFCILIGILLGSINQLVRYQQKLEDKTPPHRIALIATLWTRSVLIILEPTIGIAYILDCFVIFTSIYLLVGLVKNRNYTNRMLL